MRSRMKENPSLVANVTWNERHCLCPFHKGEDGRPKITDSKITENRQRAHFMSDDEVPLSRRDKDKSMKILDPP